MSPQISVIIPVHNAAKYVQRTLNSVWNQTAMSAAHTEVELVVVDDGSTDGSLDILEKFCADKPQIILIKLQQNLSPNVARKRGVAAATGRYITFLDGDDELDLQTCELLLAEMSSAPVDILHFNMEVVAAGDVSEAQARGFNEWVAPLADTLSGTEIMHACVVARQYSWNLCAKLFEAKLCKRAFEMVDDVFILRAEDLYAYCFLSALAQSYRGLPQPKLYRYYFGAGGDGASTITLQNYEQNWLTLPQVYERVAKQFSAAELTGQIGQRTAELAGVRQILLDDCISFYGVRIVKAEQPAAFAKLLATWPAREVINGMIERGFGGGSLRNRLIRFFSRYIPIRLLIFLYTKLYLH